MKILLILIFVMGVLVKTISFDTCILNNKNASYKLENLQAVPQCADNGTSQVNKHNPSQDAN